MKIPRFSLFAVSAAFALGLVSGSASVRAETPEESSRRQAAEEFLKVRKTEDLVNSTVTRMGEMTDRISDSASKQAGPSVDPKEFGEKMRTEAREMISKDFNWAALKPEFVQAYSQAFTEAELKEMTAFYQTPTGKKLVATEPDISGKLSKLSQEKAMAIMPRVVQHLREMVAATKPPGSAPSSLAPPLPPGMTVPPSPPPGLMIPPPPPPGAMPSAPPPAAPPTMTVPVPPSSTTVPSNPPPVHPGGKTEPGTR